MQFDRCLIECNRESAGVFEHRIGGTMRAFFIFGLLIFLASGCASVDDGKSTDVPQRAAGQNGIEESPEWLSCQKPMGHHLMYRKFVCPVGGEEFKALVLGTHSTYGRYFDLEPASYMDFPVPIPVCPSNGYVMYQSKPDGSHIKAQRKVIKSRAYKALLGKNTSYHLFAYMAEQLGDEKADLFWLHLNSTWEADQCNRDLYPGYVRNMLKHAEIEIARIDPTHEGFWVLHRTIINGYRRIGEFQEARARFDNVLHRFADEIPEDDLAVLQQLLQYIDEKNSDQQKIVWPKKDQ